MSTKNELEKDTFKIMTIWTRSLSAILGYVPRCHKVSTVYVFDGKALPEDECMPSDINSRRGLRKEDGTKEGTARLKSAMTMAVPTLEERDVYLPGEANAATCGSMWIFQFI